MTSDQLSFDRSHLWHPYTSLSKPLPVYPVASASGATITLADGWELTDGMASWWCAVHGYNVPELNAALQEQTLKMSHVMFGGFTHEPAVELGRRLVDITPAGLNKIFLADSGSVSVEVAMKMAVQYQHAKGGRQRSKFLTFRGGYHGDTTGPMSVCDPDTGMHGLFSGFIPTHHFVGRPPGGFSAPVDAAYVAELEEVFSACAAKCAAFICEPVVQGAGGMHFYNPAYLRIVNDLCTKHGLLLIFDEIATGFGRTGVMFAAEHAGFTPDIMCLGKALTGGYMTLAATLCTDEVADVIGQSEARVLMHGPTFMGNPLACAVAVASIDLLLASPWQKRVSTLSENLSLHLRPAARMGAVKDVRVLGGIGVVETHEPVDVAKAQAFYVARGVWIRPFGTRIYLMPPYIVSAEETRKLCRVILEELESRSQDAPTAAPGS
ncbi:adenosylmethionine--8-amino-7-oxononanoate transaminase [Neolewinella aurantiaca]|uniref:Adenosylmethionine-8-amino-7-oxononanoate aminotransferase n=1 Tax=Neolewinella aurantiaca TaxID=2602767 RepID=A0A5C7FUW0_9BACT|nr:adenosylmethionine--8-amino-7-oxononanoate transaminase [Neolewinella aurantiaca]TXF88624.1 adenosylmethionine--8-amino-7-oxononanoate transaminase [Neolewinella aurantiaca]